MAVIERFGERLGVRRGSNSSGSSDASSSSSVASGHTRASGLAAAVRRRSRRLSRSTTRDTSPDRPKRQHLPRKREFTLLLPPPDSTTAAAMTVGGDALNPLSRINTPRGSLNSATNSEEAVTAIGIGSADRLITTPDLAVVLDKIRALRAAVGFGPDNPASTPAAEVPMRSSRSAPGRTRPRLRQGQGASFPLPPVIRPAVPRTKSRLEVLRGQSTVDVPRPKSVSDLMGMTNPYGSSTSLSAMRSGSDFKLPSRAATPLSSPAVAPGAATSQESGQGCWWLDVACPGWEDLRDIGELLGLHPLTLEDVLQQDPREKFDTFDRLGYYFVVIRALDEEYFKYTPGSATTLVGAGEKVILEKPALSESPTLAPNNPGNKDKEGRRRGWGMGRATGKHASKEGEKVEIVEDNPGKEGLEGVGVGALNVYLVVFADGVVSFHFEDISKHTKRVLDRVLSNVSVKTSPGADWIAHGLIDSIVDAFFPLIRYVDGEVDDIDSLTVDPSTDPKALRPQPVISHMSQSSSDPDLAKDSPPLPPTENSDSIELHEKGTMIIPPPRPPATNHLKRSWKALQRAKALLPSIRLPHQLIYIKLFFLPTTSAVTKRHDLPDNPVMGRMQMVRHITHMRKLVTGMTRLLGTKHSVVGEMRKRAAEYGSGQGVDVYIGDVEDHILLLQNSLLHYESILSHCQPAYLSHLRVGFKLSKQRSDRAILALSTVAVGVLPMQLLTSAFGTNVLVFGSRDLTPAGDPYHLYWFAGIVCVMFLVICGLVAMLRWWRWDARVNRAKKRGVDLPSAWEGYWGFR